MAQLTWEAMNPIDTSRYLDSIQKAQAQSVAGVEQIGNAYKGYQDNLKKQNTNDMLTALNQAQNPEELATAQANIAAMQQRWGSGYDMDAVRTAMDERPGVLNERASKALQYQQEKAQYEAIPQINEAAAKFAAGRKGITPEMAQQLNTLAVLGIDTSGYINSLSSSANADFTTERTYNTGREDRKEDVKWREDQADQSQENWQADYDYREDESNWKRADTITKDYPKENTLTLQDGKWVTTVNPGISRMDAYGALSGVVNKMVGAESSWKADAKNKRSTATGGGQFIESTWLDVISRNRPDLVKGKSKEQILAMRNDLKLSVEMTEAYARENIASLEKANLPVTEGTIYLSKFAGPGGARSLLRANPNASAESILGREVANANPEVVKGKTVGEVIRWAENKMGGQGSSSSNTSTAAAASNAIQIPQASAAKAVSGYNIAITDLNNKFNLQTVQDQSKTAMGSKGQTIDSWLAAETTTDREGVTLFTDYAAKVAKLARNNAKLSNLPMDDQLKVLDAAHAWALTPGGVITDKWLDKRITQLATSLIDGKKSEHEQGKKNVFETQYQAFVQELNAAGMGAVSRDAFRQLVSPELAPKSTKTVPETPAASQATRAVAASGTVDNPFFSKPTPKPAPQASSQAFIPFAKLGATPVTSMTPKASSSPAKPKPQAATPKASTPKAETKAAKPTKQDVVAFYIKRGEVGNVVPNGINSQTDRQLIREAQAEATKQLAAKEAKQKADAAVKRAAAKAEAARFSKEYEAWRNAKPKTNTATQAKPVDMAQMYKTHMQQKAKEEAERKRKNK